MDAGSRERLYSTWLDESRVHGSSSLRDNISQSLQKVQEFIRKNAGAEITNEAGAEIPGFSNEEYKNGKFLARAPDAFAPSSTPEASHTTELSNKILLCESENVNAEKKRFGFSNEEYIKKETSAPARPAQNADRVAGNAGVSNNNISENSRENNPYGEKTIKGREKAVSTGKEYLDLDKEKALTGFQALGNVVPLGGT